MSNYPKIFSLSTVGIRQHNNADYLLHPIRTDFTGDNGLGKSVIADLMQLIFIPKRDMWKPGTEGVGKNDRRIEGIPLNKDYVQFGYTFINIERYQGRFICLGAYIPKNSRQPVRPFIIQKSDDWETKTLISFERPIKSWDFLGDDKKVLDLKEMKEKLKSQYGLILKDFFQSDEINLYYEMLYKNQLIPIDLTKENNLKAFAKVVQSFARAKTLDINNSRSLQNFLFEENEEIKSLFDEQKDMLVSYIRQYNMNRSIIGELETKQNKLSALKVLHDSFAEKKVDFLKNDAILASLNYVDLQKIHEENTYRLESAQTSYKKNSTEAKIHTDNILKLYSEAHAITLLMKEHYEAVLPELSDNRIEELRVRANKLLIILNELERVAPVFKKYESVKAIKAQLEAQAGIKEQKKKLEVLKSISLYAEFEASEWAKDFEKAYELYQEKLVDLPMTIAELENLTDIYESGAADSLLIWAVNQKKPLSLAQETALMHLKDVLLKKPGTNEAGIKFTKNPKALLDSIEEDKDGVWLVLGELREFVPFVEKQKFGSVKNLKSSLDKDKERIKEELEEAKREFDLVSRLNREVSAIGYNADMCEVYKNRANIQGFSLDEDLSDSIVEIIQNNLENLEQYEELKDEYRMVNEEAILIAKKQTESHIELENMVRDMLRYESELERQKGKLLTTDELNAMRRRKVDDIRIELTDIEKQLALLETEREEAERNIISAEGTINSCKERDKQLTVDFNKARLAFEEKRKALETETEFKFEDILMTGDLNDRQIKKMEYEYNTARRNYEEEFTRIVQSFEETRDHKNAEVENDKFNFYTLVRILCGKLGLEGIAPELVKLNEELKKFADLQLAIIVNVFSQVEKQYHGLKRLVTELNFFFSENRISYGYQFRIDFNERKDITIDWIAKMRERAKVQRFGNDLFTDEQGLPVASSPDQLIVGIAQQFSQVKNCELLDLLNPKFYFELRVGLFDDKNNRYSGSGGQAYTALALLCIGRLSVIQRDKNRPGVKFIIIEELSNIDDTNFGLFPQIAEQFGYQLMTMTPKPFGTYSEDSWFLHMLVRGKDKDINYQPMSFFKTKNSKKLLEDYMADVPAPGEN
jgi:exonuclease SbcC